MKQDWSRRKFLRQVGVGSALAAGLGSTLGKAEPPEDEPREETRKENRAAPGPVLKKACVWGMLGNGPWRDRFQAGRDAGFDGVEVGTLTDAKELEAVREASEATGLKVHSIMNTGHWDFPLSSPDPEVVKKCVSGIKTSLQNAHFLGAETILLVPAVVDEKTRYAEAYERSQKLIRELIPPARELNVVIAIEEVWNKFLLSPIEFARYVDELQSPQVRAYFDVGNVVIFGYPGDWIRTLGKRIAKVHVKGYDARKAEKWAFCNLREGTIDWPDVRKAFAEVGYGGWLTAELGGGDAKYLKGVVADMEKIIRGES